VLATKRIAGTHEWHFDGCVLRFVVYILRVFLHVRVLWLLQIEEDGTRRWQERLIK